MNRVRKGDEVVIISGRERGKRGTVTALVGGDRVIVEGSNMVKRHTKANPAQGISGGIVEREAPLHISNVMPYNPRSGRGERVGYRRLADGRKVRVFKSDSEVIDV